MYLVAESDGTSSVLVRAERFAVVTGTAANASRKAPLIVRDNKVYLAELFVDTLAIEDFAVTDDASLLSQNQVTSNNGAVVTHSQIVVNVPNDRTRLDILCNMQMALNGGDLTGGIWTARVIHVQSGSTVPGMFITTAIHSSLTPLMGTAILNAGVHTFRLNVTTRSTQTVNQAFWRVGQRKK